MLNECNSMSLYIGIEVLFEFCRSAMYQQDRIKNQSAFLNHMLMQKMNTISTCSTLSTVSRDSNHSIRTNSSIHSANYSMDCRSESAHYSVASVTSGTSNTSGSLGPSLCGQHQWCSELTEESEPVDIVEEDDDDTECVHNGHGNGCDDAKHTMNGDDIDDDEQERKELDAMMHSFDKLQEQMLAQRQELDLLKKSVTEMEQKNKTLKAENRCLRERRGGPIANRDYRQSIAFWDGNLKRTVPGIDVVPIYTVGRSTVAKTGYICVGIPTPGNVQYAMPMYPYQHCNAFALPQAQPQRTNSINSPLLRNSTAMGMRV